MGPHILPCTGLPTAPEYTIVFAQRVRQIDAETIKVTSIQCLTLVPAHPAPYSCNVWTAYYSGMHERLVKHFEKTAY